MLKRLVLISLTIFGMALFIGPSAHAAGFDAGRIIDDAIFANKSSMSSSDIQSFLNGKVPTCDTQGTQPSEFGGGTRAQWAANASLHPNMGAMYPPFTCLKDYQEGGNSAAQIIYNVAQQYSINPQVLIVLLQKEQGLITDTWPLPTQYKTATGYGCPDTSVCDSQYFGLTNQITWAAKMYRAILNSSPTWYTPYVLGANYIQYNPTSSCGGSVVNIQNRATQALYNYTPYQPNQAALAANIGQTVPCGAYGNINFYRYFTSWFGSTLTDAPWVTIAQQAYTDQTKQTSVQMNNLASGQRYYLTVAIKNTSNTTWKKDGANPVNLGTTGPSDRASAYCDPSWINSTPSCNRVASLHEYQVAPGQIGSFEFWITAPSTGYYNELFAPVMEGKEWIGTGSISFPAITSAATYSAAVVGQYAYTDSTKQSTTDIRYLVPGKRYYLGINLANTGNTLWKKDGSNPVNLGTNSPRDRKSDFCDTNWLNTVDCNRVASLHEYQVAPGQIGSFEFWITAPSTGSYPEQFTPVMENVGWIDTGSAQFRLGVSPYTWNVGRQGIYTDSSKQTAVSPDSLKPNTRYYFVGELTNTGGQTWQKIGQNPATLGTSSARDRSSNLCDTTWAACNRPSTIHEYSIGPGQTGSYEFWIKTPSSTGTYSEKFTPLIEGLNWMGNQSIDINYKVTP